MVEGFIISLLSMIVIVWVGFSMAGRDEARVSASTGLSKWYHIKRRANVVNMVKADLERDYVTLTGRGVHTQTGYEITLEYLDSGGQRVETTHYFYDESEQDEQFLEKYIKDGEMYAWLDDKNRVYVPGEIKDNSETQSIFGADKVFIYTLATAIVTGVFSTIILMFTSPLWVIIHIPVIIFSSIIPQVYMYLQEMWGKVQTREYESVGAINQYALYIEEDEEKLVNKIKLVEQTLPMVVLEDGEGYLGYTSDKVSVLVDYEGNIPVHISSEYQIPKVFKDFISK